MNTAITTRPTSPCLNPSPSGKHLIYLMGASGSGKDTLLRHLRNAVQPGEPVLVAHRYITRPSSDHEGSVSLSDGEFRRRIDLGCFALHWRSHGLHYGVGIEIDAWMTGHAVVILNGSRAHLAQAHGRYPDLTAIEITVNLDILAARLIQRGRETPDQIQARLRRATQHYAVPPTCAVTPLSNDTAPEHAARQLLAITRRLSSR